MTIALIDGDIVAYRSAASCEQQGVLVEPLEVALLRTQELMLRIIQETGSDHSVSATYLSGGSQFRHTINPEYKANRKDMKKPEFLNACRQHLVDVWCAVLADNCEADDCMGIAQTKYPESTIICTIDKDLLQVPGRHYNFVKQEFREVSEKEGLFQFYWQCIMGDRTDNIFGFDGIARNTIPKKLEPLYQEMQHASSMGIEVDLFDIVRAQYNDDARLLMNGRCLWIQRVPEQLWEFPV
jgi:DNA polymerase I